MSPMVMHVPIQRYVIGFIFDRTAKKVALIRKERPDFQKGKLNGIGGHIELGESPVGAMVREAKEETGFESTKDDWLLFHYERNKRDVCLYFYAAETTDLMNKVRTMTDEEVVIMEYWGPGYSDYFPSMMYNLPWLLPMALSYIENPYHRSVEG